MIAVLIDCERSKRVVIPSWHIELRSMSMKSDRPNFFGEAVSHMTLHIQMPLYVTCVCHHLRSKWDNLLHSILRVQRLLVYLNVEFLNHMRKHHVRDCDSVESSAEVIIISCLSKILLLTIPKAVTESQQGVHVGRLPENRSNRICLVESHNGELLACYNILKLPVRHPLRTTFLLSKRRSVCTPVTIMNASCQCGAISFKTPLPEPLALYICHCVECQRQSGSAFGCSAIFPSFDLPCKENLSVYS